MRDPARRQEHMVNEHFSLGRLWWLLRADLTGGYRSLLTVSAVLAGVILITLLTPVRGPAAVQGVFVTWFGGMLYVWGAIASSRAFSELHDKTRNEAYLLLPASAIEKTLARLLPVTVGLIVYLLIFTAVVSLPVAGLSRLSLYPGIGLFNPLDPQVWPIVARYLVFQSYFFLGAAWFRKQHFIKTTLVAVVVAGTILSIVLTSYFIWVRLGSPVPSESISIPGTAGMLRLIEAHGTAFTVMVPVAGWTLAWLRVRETQVSDGI